MDHRSCIEGYLNKLNSGKGSLLMVKAVLSRMLMDKGYVDPILPEVLVFDFRLQHILERWAGKPVPRPPWEEILPDENQKFWLLDFFKRAPSFQDADPILLGETFQMEMDKEKNRQHGVFYTPLELIRTIWDMVEEPVLEGKRIMDPACGAGFILSFWYERLRDEYRRKGWSGGMAHREILEHQLYGMDLDPKAAWVTATMLQLHDATYIPAPGIRTGDFLLDTKEMPAMDLVVGNPPYVGHKQLDRPYFKTLKERYPAVYYDKGDLAYCFFQKGLETLKEGGKLAFITSRYYLEAQNAAGLRQYLLANGQVRKILDYYGQRPMLEAKVDPAITVMVKTLEPPGSQHVEVRRFREEKKSFSEPFEVSDTCLLPEGWTLLESVEQAMVDKIKSKRTMALEEIWRSRQGIITGLDKAFILNQDEANHYPQEYIKKWIKNSQVRPFKILESEKRLLHTDGIDDPETIPPVRDRLRPYRARLANRRECQKGLRAWHHLQWGRDPAFFEGEKVVYPYKASSNRFALDRNGSFYSADVYGFTVTQEACHHHTNKSITALLNSRLYEFYFKTFGKKLGGDLYEYYPNTVGRMSIPIMDPKEVKNLECCHDEIASDDPCRREEGWNELNKRIYGFFSITEEEITHLERRKEKDE